MGGEFRIYSGKIMLDICMDKVGKEARNGEVVNCSLLKEGDGVRGERDQASSVGK